MSHLISAVALAQQGADCIFDCTFMLADPDQGRLQFDRGHIPGASYVDLNCDLSISPDHRGRHPMPESEEFAQRVRSWGVNQQSKVVCYDQDTGAFAARLWWMLRWLGHHDVYLLDGGRAAWEGAGFDLTTDTVRPEEGNFVPGPPLTRCAMLVSCPTAVECCSMLAMSVASRVLKTQLIRWQDTFPVRFAQPLPAISRVGNFFLQRHCVSALRRSE